MPQPRKKMVLPEPRVRYQTLRSLLRLVSEEIQRLAPAGHHANEAIANLARCHRHLARAFYGRDSCDDAASLPSSPPPSPPPPPSASEP